MGCRAELTTELQPMSSTMQTGSVTEEDVDVGDRTRDCLSKRLDRSNVGPCRLRGKGKEEDVDDKGNKRVTRQED